MLMCEENGAIGVTIETVPEFISSISTQPLNFILIVTLVTQELCLPLFHENNDSSKSSSKLKEFKSHQQFRRNKKWCRRINRK